MVNLSTWIQHHDRLKESRSIEKILLVSLEIVEMLFKVGTSNLTDY
jgi:hypothetical protein